MLRHHGMLPQRKRAERQVQPVRANATTWVRAPSSGIFGSSCRLGDRVTKDQVIGSVSDPFGEVQIDVLATVSGLVIGRSTSPLTHEGDALFHIARFDDSREAQATFDEFHETHSVEPAWG